MLRRAPLVAVAPLVVMTAVPAHAGAAPLNCRINGDKRDGTAHRPPSAPRGVTVASRTTKTVPLSWTAANPAARDPYPFDSRVTKAIQAHLDAGVNPRRLTTGMPFYGRGWPGVQAGGGNGERQSANGAAPGQLQEEAGTRGYANLIAMVPNCTVPHDTQSISTYCYTGNGGQRWSFDDIWALRQKSAWLKSKGLLGAMIWEMSGDTASGTPMSTLHRELP